MAHMRWVGLALLVGLCGMGPGAASLSADEPKGGEAARALESGLGALRSRIEAKLKEADLLERSGRLEEALAATRDVERIYREGLADLERLLGVAGVAPGRPEAPPAPGLAPEAPEAPEPRLPGGYGDGDMPEGILPDPGFPEPPPAFGGRRARPNGEPDPAEKLRQEAVRHGLRWLAAHQSEDGGWECEGFAKWCDAKFNAGEKPDGPGKAMYDTGVTGLALCAFLGAGYTNRGDHEFAKVVRKGLSYLKNVQDPEGCFGPRSTQHYIYNHACAALAMVEAYGMTESNIYKGPAQKALDFISLARNPYFVWRYGVKPGDNDSSVTGWMMMALKSAKLINEDATKRGKAHPLTLDEEAFDGIRAWLDKMTDPDYGRVGYVTRGSGPARPQELVDRFPGEKSESMTAVGMLARIFMGDDPRKDAVIKKGADLCAKLLPTWNTNDGSIDMYYWYYATLAVFQVGGDYWKKWEEAMNTSMVANQRMDGNYCSFKGSWDPVDPWGSDGGRVYSTAILCMCLEVIYRYDKVFGAK